MSVPVLSAQQFRIPRCSQTRITFNSDKPICRNRFSVIKCCSRTVGERERKETNYYELLGVSAHSNVQEIKEAYRKLQKKYHPDIAGQEGHEYTLLLNEAYKVLINGDLRRKYDASYGFTRIQIGRDISNLGYSSWRGPTRSQALFVDENSCIGCRECVSHASSTFTMDETSGRARVKVQYADSDEKIETSVDSCPVNCIHWVEMEDLPVLEFLMRPQPKEGHGIFGQGWEQTKNVFLAAQVFKKKLRKENDSSKKKEWTTVEETPAQAKARADANKRLKMDRLSRFWNWATVILWQNLWRR